MDILGVPLLAVAGFTLASVGLLVARQARFRRRSVPVSARFVGCTPSTSGADSLSSAPSRPVVEFTVNGKVWRAEVFEYPGGPLPQPGSPMFVYHDPDNPSWVQGRVVPPDELRRWMAHAGCIAAGFALTGFLLLWFGRPS